MSFIASSVNQGRNHLRAGRFNEALACANAALSADSASPEPFLLAADIFAATGRPEHVESSIRGAIERGAPIVPLRRPLGEALAAMGRWEGAIEIFEAAAAADPASAPAWVALAVCYFQIGDYAAAATAGEKGFALDPAVPDVVEPLARALQCCGRATDALARLDASAAAGADPAALLRMRLMASLYGCTSPDSIAAVHREFGAMVERSVTPFPPRALDPNPDRRIRIAYFHSAYHSRWSPRFILSWLCEHDREQIDLTLYSTTKGPEEEAALARGRPARWRVFEGGSPRDWAQAIAADQIDVLVDLAGLTDPTWPYVLAHRPAPVCVTYLGYPHSTGLSRVDYRLIDEITDPIGHESFATERLWRLPAPFLCFRFPDSAPPVSAPPACAGAPITFGSFNVLGKIGELVIRAWANILSRVGGSRLLLKNEAVGHPNVARSVRDSFAALDINPERILTHGETKTEDEHLRMYAEVDIALDPFPYNGTTTTADALWMGVPVVALRGGHHAARVCATMLASIGRDDLVAGDLEQYVVIATGLAANPVALADARRAQRDRLAASTLCDPRRLAANLGHAYRQMWRHWCVNHAAN